MSCELVVKSGRQNLHICLAMSTGYISDLEVGTKGPPTQEFVDRLVQVLNVSHDEQLAIYEALRVSQRKLVL